MFVRNAIIAFLAAATTAAAAPAIGIIQASGHFTVEGSQVWGNATLFDGAVVETSTASSDVNLRNGVRVQLGAQSRARVWEDHLLLEKGGGQFSAPSSYEVNAAGLRIHTAKGNSRIRVGLGATIQIAALAGSARVANSTGLLIAQVPAGQNVSFAFQAAQSNVVMRSGCLVYKEPQFLLQDENTQEVIEVHGPDLALNVGNRVEVSGTLEATRPSVTPATAYLTVSTVSPRAQGGCLTVASALGATTNVPQTPGAAKPTPGGAPTPQKGMSTGAKVAIIGGIAGGGAAAAIAASSGGKKSTSP